MLALFAAAAIHAGLLSSAALDKASRRLSIPPAEIQGIVAAGNRSGMAPADVLLGLFEIGKRAHAAKYEGDNEAAAAMNQLDLHVDYIDSVPQMGPYILKLSDTLQRQKDPYTQAQICELLGCTSLLSVLSEGSAALR